MNKMTRMSGNVFFKSIILILTTPFTVFVAGCRRLKFVPTVDGKRLEGHVILSLSTGKYTPCEHRCLMESRCVSVNIGPSMEDNKVACELNDADHLQYPDDLKDFIGWTYRDTEVRNTSNAFVLKLV